MKIFVAFSILLLPPFAWAYSTGGAVESKGNYGGGYNPSLYNDIEPYIRVINTTEGNSVRLRCDSPYYPTGNEKILWKNGSYVLALDGSSLVYDYRVYPINKDSLDIRNVTKYDSGNYTCSNMYRVLTIFILYVEPLVCRPVPLPDYASIAYYPPSSNGSYYYYGQEVQYSCKPGYTLIGYATRSCTDPYYGWTYDDPTCESSYMVTFRQRMYVIEEDLRQQYEKVEQSWRYMEENRDELQNQYALMEFFIHDSTTHRMRVDEEIKKIHMELTAIRLSLLQIQNKLQTSKPYHSNPTTSTNVVTKRY